MTFVDLPSAFGSAAALRSPPFPPDSRYAAVSTTTMAVGGRTIAYLRRRFVPPMDRFALLSEYVVTDDDDRVDALATRLLGNPEQFWRLCDANAVLHPGELLELGRVLRVTLPEGIPGAPHG